MPKLRVHNIAVSLDGYMAGPDQDLDNPLGVGGLALHDWVFATRAWNAMQGTEGGEPKGRQASRVRPFQDQWGTERLAGTSTPRGE
jgi:hypothetical protein